MAKKKATKKAAPKKAVAKKTAAKKTAPKKAAKKSAKKPSKKVAKEMLLVGSKTKIALKGNGFNVSADAIDAMNDYVYWLVDQAQKKCAANGRKTIRPYDILAM